MKRSGPQVAQSALLFAEQESRNFLHVQNIVIQTFGLKTAYRVLRDGVAMTSLVRLGFVLAACFVLAGIGLGSAKSIVRAESNSSDLIDIGMASYYRYGGKTANGDSFQPHSLTAAHRTLKFGTRVRVTHIRSGRTVVVRINDRGPFTRNRIIDLSWGAARVLGLQRFGIAKVQIVVIPTRAEPSF
jgi:rare lipoprotein A